MMLDAVKHAQRQFPTKLYYREEAAALITIGDKVIQEDNVAEKYFHSRHNGIGHVISFCSKMSTGIGCGGCSKHLYVDWGDQRCWCRMGYENLYELKLLRWVIISFLIIIYNKVFRRSFWFLIWLRNSWSTVSSHLFHCKYYLCPFSIKQKTIVFRTQFWRRWMPFVKSYFTWAYELWLWNGTDETDFSLVLPNFNLNTPVE